MPRSSNAKQSPNHQWPGRARRSPRLTDRSYLVNLPLSQQLRSAIDIHLSENGGRLGTVVDVGCGSKPFYPWLAGHCDRYVGVDTVPGADVLAQSESLPFPSGYADLVLCTQVLEHVESPTETVAEIHRVLGPGGLALVSTHGVQRYHPTPEDYWRWTGSGLHKLFEQSGPFAQVDVLPNGSTVSCLLYLLATYTALAHDKADKRAGPVRAMVKTICRSGIVGFNLLGREFGASSPNVEDSMRTNSLIVNFLVVAKR